MKTWSQDLKTNLNVLVKNLDILFSFLEGSLPDKSRNKLNFKDQLSMTLVKLRLEIQFENLAQKALPMIFSSDGYN